MSTHRRTPVQAVPLMLGKRTRGPVLPDGLTSAQGAFAQHVSEGLSLSEAFRLSHQAGKMKPNTIHNRASVLYSNPKVQARVAEIREAKRVGSLHDAARALEYALVRLQREAEGAETDGARIRAIELIMRHHGLLSDQPKAGPDPLASMSAADLRQRIQERLLAALGPVIDGSIEPTSS